MGAFPWGQIAGGVLGGIFGNNSTPEPTYIDENKIKGYQAPTQGLVNEQLGLSRQMMDPQSAINLQMRKMLAQRSSESGQEVGSQMMKMGAMRNMSPSQMMMQSRMGQNQAQSGVNDHWMKSLQERFGQGMGLMGNMTGRQQGLDENIGNAYVQNIGAENQFKLNKSSNTMGGFFGGMNLGEMFD